MGINAGYMGLAKIGNAKLRFSDASVSAKQEVVIPDLVMGDKDHDSFYYGAITIDGSISGPIDENFGTDIWSWAVKRDECGLLTSREMNLWYFCDTNSGNNWLKIPQVLANNLTISATAGDVANFSIDVIGSGLNNNDPEFGVEQPENYQDIVKLVTWDAMSLSLTGNDITIEANPLISAFEISIANNVTPAYSLGGNNTLWPRDLITGIRTVTGTVTFYNMPADGFDAFNAYTSYGKVPGSVSFTVGSLSLDANVMFHRINPTANPGPITSTLAFSGVGPQATFDA